MWCCVCCAAGCKSGAAGVPGVGLVPVLHKKFAGRPRPSTCTKSTKSTKIHQRPAARAPRAQASSLLAMPPRGHGGTEERAAGVPSLLVLARGRARASGTVSGGLGGGLGPSKICSRGREQRPGRIAHSASSPIISRPSRPISHLAELAAIERLGGSAPNGPRECLRRARSRGRSILGPTPAVGEHDGAGRVLAYR